MNVAGGLSSTPGTWVVGGIACLLVVSGTAGAVAVHPLSIDRVSGDAARVDGAPWVTVESHRLNHTTGGVASVLVDVTNFHETGDRSGRITVRLRALNGTRVASANRTVHVRKNGKTAVCELSFGRPRPRSSFEIVEVVLDASVTVDRRDADCTSRGRGRG